MISAQIIESFQITNRGTVVVIDATTDLPIGHCLKAIIRHDDGTPVSYDAWKEWLLGRSEKPVENEGFLIVDASVGQVPIGESITLKIGFT